MAVLRRYASVQISRVRERRQNRGKNKMGLPGKQVFVALIRAKRAGSRADFTDLVSVS
jgi:hypothetical protein